MERKTGLAIVEVNDTETRSFFIDQDALECARLNAQTRKRREQRAKEEKETAHNRRKAAQVAARRRAYTIKTFSYALTCGVISGGVAWAGTVGMIHPAIYIPVICVCLCVACARLGAWFGRMVK